MTNESWKVIPDFPNYECSDTGKIRSLLNLKELKIRKNNSGYPLINLYNNGKMKTLTIHRIVAKLFINNFENYLIVNHIDGIKDNNNYSNLEWCDHQHNMRHAFRLNLRNDMKGENNYSAKLTFEKVEEIRQKYLSGEFTFLSLSKLYNMSLLSIKRIIRNISWYDKNYDNQEYKDKLKLINKINNKKAIQNSVCKLNSDEVYNIRELYKNEYMTMSLLAKKFKVTKTTICSIINYKTWI